MDSPYGRLYAHPNTEGTLTNDIDKDLAAGILVPSVTNVIGILEKPHLYDWYARKSTQAAIDVAFQHPGLITKKPREARKWLSGAARRHMNEAADLGTRVHEICERLANGESKVEVGEQETPYINSWYQFNEEFQPSYSHVESTVFGAVVAEAGDLGYAGTADFFAEIGGYKVVGDLKTGRSIHTEAGIQLNALAAAQELVDDDAKISAVPDCDFGLVVHLGQDKFSVRMVPLTSEAFNIFEILRSVWNFHVSNAASSGPLLMTGAVSSRSDMDALADGLLGG